jgi:DNA repair protein RadC
MDDLMDAPLASTLAEQTPCDQSLEHLLAGLLAPRLGLAAAEAMGRRLLVAAGGLRRLRRLTAAELGRELGDDADGLRVACALELGRRAGQVGPPRGRSVVGASDLEPHLRGRFAGLEKEVFLVLLLDAKHRLVRTERVSEGCLTWSVVHPREVFAPAVREGAGAVIVAHNHPSGDPSPSRQDVSVTARLARVGALLGIPLLDHLVVGHSRVVSLRAEGHLPSTDGWSDGWG